MFLQRGRQAIGQELLLISVLEILALAQEAAPLPPALDERARVSARLALE